MARQRLFLRLLIYGLLAFAFFLGLPQYHYATALMIAVIIRHRDEPLGLFAPVGAAELKLPPRVGRPAAARAAVLTRRTIGR